MQEDKISISMAKGSWIMPSYLQASKHEALDYWQTSDSELTYSELHASILAAAQQCGCNDNASQSIVPIMANIEAKLDECLSASSHVPAAFIDEWEKAREKERRQVCASLVCCKEFLIGLLSADMPRPRRNSAKHVKTISGIVRHAFAGSKA